MSRNEQRVGARAEQKRRWDRDNRPVCATPGCTNRIARHSHRCMECHVREVVRRIQALWEDGVSTREIARQLNTTEGTISVDIQRMRRRGWNLPMRHHARS